MTGPIIFAAYGVGALATYVFLWATRMDTMNPVEAMGLSLAWPATLMVYLMKGGWWK